LYTGDITWKLLTHCYEEWGILVAYFWEDWGLILLLQDQFIQKSSPDAFIYLFRYFLILDALCLNEYSMSQ
jgi:hypothetical protein